MGAEGVDTRKREGKEEGKKREAVLKGRVRGTN